MQYNKFSIDQFIVLKLQFQRLKPYDYGDTWLIKGVSC